MEYVIWSHSGVWSLDLLRSLVAEVWSHSGVWSLKSGGWNLESLRNLEYGVWSLDSLRSLESGVWSHPGVWSLEFGVTPESGG